MLGERMKYGRGRVIAVALLSTVLALLLSGFGFLLGFSNLQTQAGDNDNYDPYHIPTFDEAYVFDPITTSGEITLGQNAGAATIFALRDESYRSDSVTALFNASQKLGFSSLRNKRNRDPYALFTDADMQSIVNGIGMNDYGVKYDDNNGNGQFDYEDQNGNGQFDVGEDTKQDKFVAYCLQTPVIMLDTINVNQAIVFELLNLPLAPSINKKTRNGEDIPIKNIVLASGQNADHVYGSSFTQTTMPMTKEEVKAFNDQKRQEIIQGNVGLNKGDPGWIDPDDSVNYLDYDAMLAKNTYEMIGEGAIASCGTSLRGVFNQEGLYEFDFTLSVPGANGVITEIKLAFAFYITDRSHYTAYPSFPDENRAAGNGNVYNYSFGGEYPTVTYNENYFDVVITSTEKYADSANDDSIQNVGDGRTLQFSAVGEYTMTSYLKNYYFYVDQADPSKSIYRELRLPRYRANVSVLYIRGFQAYYGGQHNQPEYNGPLPFYNASTVNSNITPWVTNNHYNLVDMVKNKNPDANATLAYAKLLTDVLDREDAKEDDSTKLVPIRTNFPPVQFVGNVNHAYGAGLGGENVRLSTVSFKGVDDFSWGEPTTYEPGKPFTDAGRYLVMMYFWVNKTLCQQTFYFEISNALEMKFAVTGTEGKGYEILEYDELVRKGGRAQGKAITIMYNGATKLGEFEVPPTITLERASLSDPRHFTNIEINKATDGSFNFYLAPACYRLTVVYGAYGQAATVIELLVDNTSATNITTTAQYQQPRLSNLPTNTAIWGMGNITLSWDKKVSGIGFRNVQVDYYRSLIEDAKADPNAAINYTNYDPSQTNLFATTIFSEERTATRDYTPVLADDRWCLTEKFNQAGVYLITLTDDVGNETQYLLIIDDAKPTFVQKSPAPVNSSNVVAYDKNGINVGFGRNKMVMFNVDLANDAPFKDWQQFADLREQQLIVPTATGKYALSIPLAKAEMNVNGGVYETLSRAELELGYKIVYKDDTYYFRVTDVLGNVSEYYIILSNDISRGIIYAEDSEQSFSSTRGFLANNKPNMMTSLVTAKGGMTNRNYLTFSFDQVEKGATAYRVSTIKLEYYPFTFDTKSPNYPFAANPVTYLRGRQDSAGIIYRVDNSEQGDGKGTFRLALYNSGEITPRGLFIITRTYETTSSDDTTRSYYFIVDDRPMLSYEADVYQSDLRIRFGADDKIANAKKFEDFHYELRSNRAAEIAGYSSKYHGTTRYLGYDFPSLIPRFSCVNNGQTTNLGEGAINVVLGNEPTGDVNYKLVVADNARNFPVLLTGGAITEIIPTGKSTSANYSELLLILDTGYGTKAQLIKNGQNDTPITNTQMEYDVTTGVYTYVVDPDDIKTLTFEFTSDPDSLYADIDIEATTASWFTIGLDHSAYIVPEIDGTIYRYDIANTFLNSAGFRSGASVGVSLITKDNQHTDYNIVFDLDDGEPTYNLRRIIEQDNLAKDLAEIPDGYIYGLSTKFVFAPDTTGNRYLDTKEISYREVNYQGDGSLPKTIFRLDSGLTFADIVGLRDNEMKYFRITETDYAGHVDDYVVQIQGEKYNGAVTYVGAIPDKNTDDGTVLGIEMRVATASAQQFYRNNNSFKFVNGEEYYAVYCGTAKWYLNGKAGTGASSEAELVAVLNEWINDATELGQRCRYVLYDRMGEPKVFACYNLREDAVKLQLEAYNLIPDAVVTSPVCLQTVNYDSLPLILKDPDLAKFYQIKITDVATQRPLDNNLTFTLGITTLYNISQGQELIIEVTDPFNRVSITEYHGQDEVGLQFAPYGNTVDIEGVTYVGDSRGVQFSFLRTVYTINVYNADTGALVGNLPTFIQGDKVTYSFVPSALRADTTRYRLEAVGRSSHAVLYEKIFAFDTRLPQVIWTKSDDQEIAVNDHTFTGTINLHVVPNPMLRFSTTVSYQRTFNGMVEQVTLPKGIETFQFDQSGDYVVTLRNAIWATSVYNFKIANTSEALINVYDDDQLLTPSTSMYFYQGVPINNYIFTMETRVNDNGVEELLDLTNYEAHGLRFIPAETSNRQLVWRNENQAFQEYDRQNNTLVWRFAVVSKDEFGQTVYTNDLYLATTGVPRADIKGFTLAINEDNLRPYHETYRVLTADKIPSTGISLRLQTDNNNETGIPDEYNTSPGNSVLVDCYRNGELVKTLTHEETFNLTAGDAGYYQFRVHDLVGNTLQFGNNGAEQDYYALVILTKPMVVINDANPVKHMIYNDRVEFKITDDVEHLLQLEYGEEFFNQYFKIASLEVTCNGEPLTIDLKSNPTSFLWDQQGTYLVRLKYQIGETLQQTIEDQYEFEIIPRYTAMASWSMNIYPDIRILSVRRNNYLLRDFVEPAVGEALTFAAEENTGHYEIVLQSHDVINGYKTHTIEFNINYKNSNSLNYFWLDTASGLSTTTAVTLSYQPKMLYYARGECRITLYKDFKMVETREINADSVAEMGINDLATLSASAVGLYTVQVLDEEGDIVYADSWTIAKGKSSTGMIITAIIAGIAGLGLIVFIRLRRKITVK